jgi:protein SMG9
VYLCFSGCVQPVFSPSVLSDIMRPDGSSSISVVGGDLMSAELAHELMGLQVSS